MDKKNSDIVDKKTELVSKSSPLRKSIDSTRTAVPPVILNFITMDDMAVRQAIATAATVEIRNYFADRTSNGLIQTFGSDGTLTVTDELKEIKFDFPAQSASVVNDGSHEVSIWVNTMVRPSHRMKRGETYDIGFETHKLNYLYFQCAEGESTTIRIVAND